jgi:myo-inositol-1(or 4)-monophosphatase
MTYQKELTTAKRAAESAGKYLMKIFGRPAGNGTSFKKHNEIVTEADIAADKIIKKIIKSAFPQDELLSEELSPQKRVSPRLWLVDPLDGTNNFAHGLPLFAVCVAFAARDRLRAGVVYLPYFKEFFWATESGGAYLNSKKISVSAEKKLSGSFILQCHGYSQNYKKIDQKILGPLKLAAGATRRLGVAGFELSSVARGNTDGGYIIGTRPWDSAAGALIVREAGGTVTDFRGKDWGIWDDSILFSNGKIHKDLLKIVYDSKN